jgi:predicted alpha/beta superfamily hydrolase
MLAVMTLVGCQSAATQQDVESKSTIPLDHLPALSGDYFKLESRSVGRSFHIYVRLPEGYDATASAAYPVVYLLDGDSLFPILAANHLFLSYDVDLPKAIIVGIAYGSFDPVTNKRGFDFSAPATDATSEQGGASEFLSFLKSELLPEVERRYRVDPARRVLFGQSRGGYMVLYSAFVDPDLFWGSIASNPTFDPGRELFFSGPAPAARTDLGLVVTSGSLDIPTLREAALDWFEVWKDRDGAPWAIKTATIEGGTHAANSPDSYRLGMIWLFNRD